MSQYSGIVGKRILITGATSGLGLAMAQALLKEGAKVVVSGQDQSQIDPNVSSLQTCHGECIGVLLDVRDEQSFEKGVAEIVRRWAAVGNRLARSKSRKIRIQRRWPEMMASAEA
jgi:NADP-dependent 3-hydroxy acid dehydrogenase YdfG